MDCTIENKKQLDVINFPCYNNSIHDMDGEVWIPVKGYEDVYEVSVFGRIRGVDRTVKHWQGGIKKQKGKVLFQYIDKKGYCQVQLNKNGSGKTFPVHRIVALSFLPNPENKPDVNHKFGIKKDNKYYQLEWLTEKEHAIHTFQFQGRGETHPLFGKRGSLNKKSKAVIKYSLQDEIIAEYGGCRQAERETGICYVSICRCCVGKIKIAGGFKWKFK